MVFQPPALQGGHLQDPLLPVLASSAVIMLCMWGYSKYMASRHLRDSEKLGRIKNGDRVLVGILRNFSLGSVQDFYFRGIKQKVQTVTIEFRDLSVTIKGQQNKTLLDRVSGTFRAGHMSAIMGPTGAGKTTFLNAVCGKLKTRGGWEVSGDVLINGQKTNITDLKPVIGFVPQDDVVHESMTVRENIRFSAELRNAAGTRKKTLKKVTDDVLRVLQLEPQQNVLVGNRITSTGLSGGQRKRVNIGLELAACPTVLFLDEPTSGLDATTSLCLCEMLKKMTHLGMTVVMVIHQPRYSLFTLIDDVLLLGKGGRTGYIGPTKVAKEYLEGLGFAKPADENPADWMMDILSGHVAIENARMPTETLPEALFHEWEQAQESGSFTRQCSRQASIRGRNANDSDEREVIKRHVKDEWEKCCPDAGALDKKGFTQLLGLCLGFDLADSKIAEDLMAVVTNREEAETVTQQQFVRYLLRYREDNRRGVVAGDSDPGLPERSDEDEDEDEDEDSAVSSSDSEAGEQLQNDLDRQLPGCCRNFAIEVQRNLITWWRRMTIRMCFLFVIVFSAAFLGFFNVCIFRNPEWMPTTFLNLHISTALLVSVFSLTCFGLDQPIYWREASHGLNRFAFMKARMLVDMLDWLVLTFFFAATYYCIALPELYFQVYIVPFILVAFVASGWGYLISCVLPPVLAPFVAAVLAFMLGGILGLPNEMDKLLDKSYLEFIVDAICFTRWSVPMEFLAYVSRHEPNMTALSGEQIYQLDAYKRGYNETGHWHLDVGRDSPWWTGMLALLSMGTVLRVACYPALRFMNAGKQV